MEQVGKPNADHSRKEENQKNASTEKERFEGRLYSQ
jgi:hypothetical protein